MATILIVDDQPSLRLVCRIMLEHHQFNVIEAGNGREAISLYRQFHPDGVLLDINMPVLDGLATLEQIRQIDPEARVAMLSAFGQERIVTQALQAGASAFIIKPFSSTRLNQAVRELLGEALPSAEFTDS